MEQSQLLNELERDFRLVDPNFEVLFKDKSPFMKVLGVLTAPFNPEFMTRYITTIGSKVYFPDEEHYLRGVGSPSVLCHEFVHIMDGMRHGWRFKFSYLMPQLLGLLPLVALLIVPWGALSALLFLLAYATGALVCKANRVAGLVVLGVLLVAVLGLTILWTGWFSTLLLGALVGFAPWPSPWRTHWELRGYAMTIAYRWWTRKKVSDLDWLGVQFTGPYYWFMSWQPKKIREKLQDLVVQVKTGELEMQQPYARVRDLLYRLDLLRP